MRSVLNRGLFAAVVGMALLLTPNVPVGAAPAWTTVASTLRYQKYSAAAAGPNGKVYVFGDYDAQSSGEAYDPATNTWTMLPPMRPGRFWTAAASVGGKIYVLGGLSHGAGVRTLNQAYDPATNTWTTLAPMPLGGDKITAAPGPDGKIYVFGGYRRGWGVDGHGDLKAVQIYDPRTNTWTYNRNLPRPLRGSAAALGSDGRIYLIGGWDFGVRRDTPGYAWAYDTTSGTFTPIASLGWWREGLGAVSGDGVIYAIGGVHSSYSFTTTKVYTIATNTWSNGPVMPTGKSYAGVTQTADGMIYAIAGLVDGVIPTKTVYALNRKALHAERKPGSGDAGQELQ